MGGGNVQTSSLHRSLKASLLESDETIRNIYRVIKLFSYSCGTSVPNHHSPVLVL